MPTPKTTAPGTAHAGDGLIRNRARPDRITDTAHAVAMRATLPEIAAFLQELLGQQLTALIAGTREPKVVGQWARGLHTPRPPAAQRLRAAYHIASVLLEQEAPTTVCSWFMGMNPHLEDRPPALVIAEGGAPHALAAARAFLAGAGA